MELHRRLQQRK